MHNHFRQNILFYIVHLWLTINFVFNHHIQEYIQHVIGQISSTVHFYPSNSIKFILHTQINTEHSYHLQLSIHQFKGSTTNQLNSQTDVLYYLGNFKVIVQLSDISPFPHPNNHCQSLQQNRFTLIISHHWSPKTLMDHCPIHLPLHYPNSSFSLYVHQLFISHHLKSFLCAPNSFITPKIILRYTKVFYHPIQTPFTFLKIILMYTQPFHHIIQNHFYVH